MATIPESDTLLGLTGLMENHADQSKDSVKMEKGGINVSGKSLEATWNSLKRSEIKTSSSSNARKRTSSFTLQVLNSEKQRLNFERASSIDLKAAAAETWLLTKLAFKLLRYLGLGYKWINRFSWLMLYAVVLLPGFLQVLYFYFLSGQVLRSVPYSPRARNTLDLYLPQKHSKRRKPVVIFVTGGAWVIGYKGWGALLGQALAENGVIVASIDYRNFPQGTVTDMVCDITTGMAWVFENISAYGGDSKRVFLVGQSAGAHLASLTLLLQASGEASDPLGNLPWRASHLKAFFGISGGYNLVDLIDHFDRRGLYRSLFLSIMEGETSLPAYSPELMVKSSVFLGAAPTLPNIVLYHGTGDYSIPHKSSGDFARTLKEVGVDVRVEFYAGKTHTDLILQDPMRGGQDELLSDMLSVIHGQNKLGLHADKGVKARPRLVPEFLLQIARFVSPF